MESGDPFRLSDALNDRPDGRDIQAPHYPTLGG